MLKNVEKFINRLQKIGIKIEMVANYPWIYIDKINGKKVTETFQGEHGFTAFMMDKVTDITKIFKLIRKYDIQN